MKCVLFTLPMGLVGIAPFYVDANPIGVAHIFDRVWMVFRQRIAVNQKTKPNRFHFLNIQRITKKIDIYVSGIL